MSRAFSLHFAPAARSGPRAGFTLVEVLTSVVVAGLLAASLASLFGSALSAGSALEEASEAQQARAVLRRILDLDIRNMVVDEEFQITEQGFSLKTTHNHLLSGPLPVLVNWTFSPAGVVRVEEQPDLEYAKTLVLSDSLEHGEAAYYDLSAEVWVDGRAWLRATERPAPAGLRLRLDLRDLGRVEIVQRLPLRAEEE